MQEGSIMTTENLLPKEDPSPSKKNQEGSTFFQDWAFLFQKG